MRAGVRERVRGEGEGEGEGRSQPSKHRPEPPALSLNPRALSKARRPCSLIHVNRKENICLFIKKNCLFQTRR